MPNVRAREDKDEEVIGVNKKGRKEEEENIIEGQTVVVAMNCQKKMTQLTLIQVIKKIQM